MQSVGKSRVGEGRGVKTKETGGKGGTETEEREKEGKKQGQYTQRNVVLQTVKLAKLKCTVTMGTLGEKEEKKINNEYRKRQRQYVLLNNMVCLFKLHKYSITCFSNPM